jgi:beta-galactosidase
MGEFIWTGFDYLGEPTPYYTEWPSRSSYFGVVDLAGLPKNRYYCYRAAWTDIPTLHIFPHWNWEGKEGQVVPIHIYTNYDEVELFINGVSQGKRRRAKSGNSNEAQLERFRLMWNDTVYEPGEICAVAYKNGVEAERKTVRTAGAPYRIELSAYSKTICADGESLNYVTAKIVDKNGNLCPGADNRLTFRAEGSAIVYATDAGDQRETETFLRPDKKALSGMLVCCLLSNENKGKATVVCSAERLISGSVSFECI